MAVEYITSRNMISLIYETMRVMNVGAAHHGVRVGYIMAKLLETRGTYEKYEIADFMILAMLHDIGAFKTDDVRKQLTYEAKKDASALDIRISFPEIPCSFWGTFQDDPVPSYGLHKDKGSGLPLPL